MRPACINNKSARAALVRNSAGTLRVLDDAAQAQADMYVWTIDDDLGVQPDYFERTLFWTGTLGVVPDRKKRVKALFVPAGALKIDVYGGIVEWQPTRIDPTDAMTFIGRRFAATDCPVLQLPYLPSYAVSGYAELISDALISIGQNVTGMRQPIVLKGQMGQIALHYAKSMIDNEDTYIPVVADGEGSVNREIEVLDLKVTNFIDPLTNLKDAADGWMSAVLGIDAKGTQKASGVSEVEATSMDTRIVARRDNALEQRKAWCEKVNRLYGTNISVEIRHAYKADRNTAADPVDNDLYYDKDNEGKEEEQEL